MRQRIEHIFLEAIKDDNSFKESEPWFGLFFGNKRYTKREMRETWEDGIKHGIGIGLYKASLEGQKIEINTNIQNEKHKEFIEKLYALYADYGFGIQYHPKHGMCVVEFKKTQL